MFLLDSLVSYHEMLLYFLLTVKTTVKMIVSVTPRFKFSTLWGGDRKKDKQHEIMDILSIFSNFLSIKKTYTRRFRSVKVSCFMIFPFNISSYMSLFWISLRTTSTKNSGSYHVRKSQNFGTVCWMSSGSKHFKSFWKQWKTSVGRIMRRVELRNGCDHYFSEHCHGNNLRCVINPFFSFIRYNLVFEVL